MDVNGVLSVYGNSRIVMAARDLAHTRLSCGRAFLLHPSYNMNKVFAAYLHPLYLPLTILGGYYSREHASRANIS